MSVVVPFRRELKEGMRGIDVVSIKRALSRAGYMQWGPFTQTYGPFAVSAVKAFQAHSKLHADGVYGKNTHLALLHTHRKHHPKEWAFDSRSAWLMAQVQVTTPGERTRAAVVAAAMYAYAERQFESYRQYRPMRDMAPPPNVPNEMDCSQFATWAYECARAPDPNGRHFDGYGNTTSMRQHGRSIELADAQKADLVFYSNPDHVGVLVATLRVVEHGSNAGPLLVPANYRRIVDVRSYII